MTSTAKTPKPQGIQEFTAILFAGLGGNLSPLSNAENLPKALLPVANKALLSYPLAWVERAGISSIIILCLDTHEASISAWLRGYKGLHKPTLVAASSEDVVEGSADALRNLLADSKHVIRPDVLLLSCDSICEEAPYKFLDFYRRTETSFAAMFHHNDSSKPGSRTFTGHAGDSLLYVNSEADVDGDLELRMSLLQQHAKLTLTTSLTDLHVYACKRWILDLVSRVEDLSRLNTDLLPLLCKAQYQPLLREKYNIPQCNVKMHVCTDYSVRVNTKQSYIDVSRNMMKSAVTETATIGDRSTVSQDSILGQACVIDEKVTIKRSILGSGVAVGKMVRLTGCIIMNNVTIADSVKLENCVVCSNVTIGEKCTFKDTIFGGSLQVAAKSEGKGEERVVGGEISMGA